MSSALSKVKKTWTKPINYSFHIDCPCNMGAPHTLDLEECLNKNILMCASRRPIDTAGIKTQFQYGESEIYNIPYTDIPNCKLRLSYEGGYESSNQLPLVKSLAVFKPIIKLALTHLVVLSMDTPLFHRNISFWKNCSFKLLSRYPCHFQKVSAPRQLCSL